MVFKTPEGTTIEQIEKTLKEVSIDGSSYHFDTKELSITCFDEEEADNIINKLKNTYEYEKYRPQNSRYLVNKSRRDLYKAWLNSEVGNKDGRIRNACSKALAICEAAARYPEKVDEAKRFEAALIEHIPLKQGLRPFWSLFPYKSQPTLYYVKFWLIVE